MSEQNYTARRLAEIAAEHAAAAVRLGAEPLRDSPSEPLRDSPQAGIARRLCRYGLTLAEYTALYGEHNGQCRLCHKIVRSIIPDRFDCRSRRGPGAGTAQLARINERLVLLCRACYTGLRLFELSAERLRQAEELCGR